MRSSRQEPVVTAHTQITPHGRDRGSGSAAAAMGHCCPTDTSGAFSWQSLPDYKTLKSVMTLKSDAESITKSLRNFVLRPRGSDRPYLTACWRAGCGELVCKGCACSQLAGHPPKYSKPCPAVLQGTISTEAQSPSPLPAQASTRVTQLLAPEEPTLR